MPFRGFSPQSPGAATSGPVEKQNIMAGSVWWSKMTHFVVNKRERER